MVSVCEPGLFVLFYCPVALIPTLFVCCWRARIHIRHSCSSIRVRPTTFDQWAHREQAEHTLARLQLAAQRIQRVIVISCFQLGWALITFSFCYIAWNEARHASCGLTADSLRLKARSQLVLVPFGLCSMLLGLRPCDRVAITLCALFTGLVFSGVATVCVQRLGSEYAPKFSRIQDADSTRSHRLDMVVICTLLAIFASGSLGYLHLALRRHLAPRKRLFRLWAISRLIGSCGGVAFLCIFCLAAANGSHDLGEHRYLAQGGVSWLGLSLICRPGVRSRIHRFLGSLVSRGEAQQAAVISSLITGGTGGAARALRLARENFRLFPLQKLEDADLAKGRERGEMTSMHARSEPAQLGRGDAFLSHSWSDDAVAKTAALRRWGRRHERQTGQPPLLWIDKACLDQKDVSKNLACLPINLSGCRQLLIVAGPTYTSRLWCIMEIFVYVGMGRTLEHITVIPLLDKQSRARLAPAPAPAGAPAPAPAGEDEFDRVASGREGLNQLRRNFDTFDVSGCQCFKPEDRSNLLAVIETGFGGTEPFNHLVRGMFHSQSRLSLAVAHPTDPHSQLQRSAQPWWSRFTSKQHSSNNMHRSRWQTKPHSAHKSDAKSNSTNHTDRRTDEGSSVRSELAQLAAPDQNAGARRTSGVDRAEFMMLSSHRDSQQLARDLMHSSSKMTHFGSSSFDTMSFCGTMCGPGQQECGTVLEEQREGGASLGSAASGAAGSGK